MAVVSASMVELPGAATLVGRPAGGAVWAAYTPATMGLATPLEHGVLGALMALPLAATCTAGWGSITSASWNTATLSPLWWPAGFGPLGPDLASGGALPFRRRRLAAPFGGQRRRL